MDVNDLKGLFAEVNKRMNGAMDHVRHELAGVRTVLNSRRMASTALSMCSRAWLIDGIVPPRFRPRLRARR